MTEQDVYCINCGEDEALAYLGSGPTTDRWQCKICSDQFQTTKEKENEKEVF